jgi:hypothetical protein
VLNFLNFNNICEFLMQTSFFTKYSWHHVKSNYFYSAVIIIKHETTFVNKAENHCSYIRIFDLIDKCRYVSYAYDGSILFVFFHKNTKNKSIVYFETSKPQQWWKLKHIFGIHGRFFWKCATVESGLKFANLNKTTHKFNENLTWCHEYLVKNEVCIKNSQILLKFKKFNSFLFLNGKFKNIQFPQS